MSAPALRVLIVDDEPPIRKLLRMGLGTQGYDVLDAPNGKTALELMASKPDLVILDLGLPDMQGLELLRLMRAQNEGVPIVVLSSRGDEAAKVAALDLGADDYVTKPFGMEELLARIRAALRTSYRCTANARCSAKAISRSIWCAGWSRSATRT
jgi:Response regulators consisting of a CheY-like receiver domain and a winged-helix DNA-binding domain